MSDVFIVAPKRAKRAGAKKAFTADLRSFLRSYWIPGRRYASGDSIRATIQPGFAFINNGAAGESGATEPAWIQVLGQTTVDGSLNWTCVAPGTNALDPISSVTWAILTGDGAVTISSQSNTLEEATADFSGGTSGKIYRAQALVTTLSGLIYDVQFDIQVS